MEDLAIFIGKQHVGWFTFYFWSPDVAIDSYIGRKDINGCSVLLEDDYVFLVAKEAIPIDNNYVRPIELPTTDLLDLKFKTARLVGWGEVSPDEWRATELRWADMTIQPDEYCRLRLDDEDYTLGSTLCAFSDHSGCRGDSGGPVQFWDGNKWILIGVFSSVVLDLSQDADLCGPDRLMLIKRVPAKWRSLVRKLTGQVAFGVTPSRDEFRHRMGGGWTRYS